MPKATYHYPYFWTDPTRLGRSTDGHLFPEFTRRHTNIMMERSWMLGQKGSTMMSRIGSKRSRPSCRNKIRMAHRSVVDRLTRKFFEQVVRRKEDEWSGSVR
ncbi:hypothetical protein Rs2_35729 [Raphanus sativus]|nr:hypothetical protein Rs2_35729 [Raphanus sativus]